MKPAHDAIVFDLDGTLWDATQASARGWTRAARAHGVARDVTPLQIAGVCGLPFEACVGRLFPDVDEATLAALKPDLARCEEAAVRERGGELYPGVAVGLRGLAKARPLFLVSNCDRWYLELFLEHSGLADLFRDGLCHGDTGQPKARTLARLRERHDLRVPVYVGDTEGDRAAARDAGYAFVWASYGFGELDGAARHDDFAQVCARLRGDALG